METLSKSPLTTAQLEAAAAQNHRELFELEARASGGEVREQGGATWTFSRGRGQSQIPFPRLSPDSAGPVLDEIVRYFLDRRPQRMVGLWSLLPYEPADLDARLLARGFQTGWQPRWMSLDLAELKAEHTLAEGVEIGPLEGAPAADNVPYYEPQLVPVQQRMAELAPGRCHRFGATLNGTLLGHTVLFLSSGGFGGIYSVGVAERNRNQGIGRSLVTAACRQARASGARYVLLNATGERMYETVGFRGIGWGQTWWLNVPRLAKSVPVPEQVALAEAVGRGDLLTLNRVFGSAKAGELDQPLPNGMTLVQLAVHSRKPEAVQWLVEHGAVLDAISAWDLGWKERAAEVLSGRPELANLPWGESGLTPLHVAVERGDLELARVVLATRPDLTIQDPAFHSTALGWAKHFGKEEFIRLIESAAPPGETA